jgi:hypothetical protein
LLLRQLAAQREAKVEQIPAHAFADFVGTRCECAELLGRSVVALHRGKNVFLESFALGLKTLGLRLDLIQGVVDWFA